MFTKWSKCAALAGALVWGWAYRAEAIVITSSTPCFDVAIPPLSGVCPAPDRPLVVGMTRRLLLDVQNDEGVPVQLLNPGLATPFFLCTTASGVCTAPTFPLSVAVGATQTIYVEYRPTAAGSHTQTINVNATPNGTFASVGAVGSAHLLDLMLLFDNSGSMSWSPDGTETADILQSRLRFARDAANELVTLLGGIPGITTGTRAGVCIFNYSGLPSDPAACPQPLSAFASGPLITAIGGVPIVWEGTQMGRGLQAVQDRMGAKIVCPTGHKCVALMLSNGAHNQGIAPEGLLAGKRVSLFSIGYGSLRDVEPARLQALVTESGNTPAAGFRHFDPTACPASVPAEQCLNTTKALDGFFGSVLQSLGLLQASVDPRATISPGQTKTHDISVVDLDRTAQFVVSSEAPPSSRVQFDLLDPAGSVVDPVVAKQDKDVEFITGSSYALYRIHQGYLGRLGKLGMWKIRLRYPGLGNDRTHVSSVSGPTGPVGPFAYSYSALMASDLELHVAFDKSSYSTGEPMLITASVTANGVRLNGAAIASVRALMDRPQQGIGTWHAAHSAQPQWIASIPAVRTGEPLSATQRKGLAVTLVGGVATPQRVAVPELIFTDDGQNGDAQASDGIYTARFTDTSKPDTYTFQILVSGKTPAGWTFTREALLQQFIPVQVVPDPATSPLTYQVLNVVGRNTTQVRVQVIPKDRFGNYLGPNYVGAIDFQTTAGKWLGPIDDDLQGGYSRVLEFRPAAHSPDVTVTVQGKSFPTDDVKERLRPRFQLEAFVGGFFFSNFIAIADGPVFGLRAAIPIRGGLNIEAEGGITPTSDKLGVKGRVYQAIGSLRWDLAGLSFGNVTPFVTGGAGWLSFSGFTTSDTSGLVQFGGGLLAQISPHTRLRLDAREVFGLDTYARTTNNLQVTADVAIGF